MTNLAHVDANTPDPVSAEERFDLALSQVRDLFGPDRAQLDDLLSEHPDVAARLASAAGVVLAAEFGRPIMIDGEEPQIEPYWR